MYEIPFVPMPKIPRLRREIIITEKIDGTNASIAIGADGSFLVGSRTRWITPQSDNFGFAAWAYRNRDALITALGVGHHFGEWYGVGIQRGYDLTERRFALFNAPRWAEAVKTFPQVLANVGVVPVIYTGAFDDSAIDSSLQSLRDNGSLAVPGYMDPEGIVVFHKASQQVFKVTCEDDEQPKGRAQA